MYYIIIIYEKLKFIAVLTSDSTRYNNLNRSIFFFPVIVLVFSYSERETVGGLIVIVFLLSFVCKLYNMASRSRKGGYPKRQCSLLIIPLR